MHNLASTGVSLLKMKQLSATNENSQIPQQCAATSMNSQTMHQRKSFGYPFL